MVQFTESQELAIETTGSDLLVSASAGTGKTAVLVERVLRLCTRPEGAVDLDRLLIVTFTEAAAAEMRERLQVALSGALDRGEGDTRLLRRQLVLLDRAQISTIHSFCASLLRQHFHRLGLDPDFGVQSEDQAHLLQAEVMEQLFRDYLERGDWRFLEWLETFAAADPSEGAGAELRQLRDFYVSLADGKAWLAMARSAYPLDKDGRGAVSPAREQAWFEAWKRGHWERVERLAEMAKASTQRACELGVDEKLVVYLSDAAQCLASANRCFREGQEEEAIRLVREYVFATYPGPRGKKRTAETDALKVAVDLWREEWKKIYTGTPAKGVPSTGALPSELARAHAASASRVHLLLDLLEDFEERYLAAKRRRRMVDFSDLENFALALLRDASGGASDVALACRDRFEYVLIDEYQDVNPLQDEIFRLVSRGDDADRAGNLFVVGDIKQCIYQFRRAEPGLFLAKYRGAEDLREAGDASASRRVDLQENFRSTSGVLEAVNAVCGAVMLEETAGFEYDEKARLRAGLDSGDYPTGYAPGELMLVDLPGRGDVDEAEDNDYADLSNVEKEGFAVGHRILSYVRSGEPVVRDRESGQWRGARFGDMAVLLRSVATDGMRFAWVFGQLGIPYFVDLGRGFFSAQEVRDLLNLLRVLDNPFQDIALASVLRSPIMGWSEDELGAVRLWDMKRQFCEAFYGAADANEGDLGRKAREAVERIEAWRTMARGLAVEDLLEQLLDQTGYLHYIVGLDSAAGAEANLRQLLEIGRQFDTFSRQGIGRFVRFLDELSERGQDYGEAQEVGEQENVVRIMTVHKSKGLEFPVVFVSRLGRKISSGGRGGGNLKLSQVNGLGLRMVDNERGERYETPLRMVIGEEERRTEREEELRILYVAMTRARDKLILTGGVSKAGEKLAAWHEASALEAEALDSAATVMDWVAPAVAQDVSGLFNIEVLEDSDIAGAGADFSAVRMTPSKDGPERSALDEATVERVRRQVEWAYPHGALGRQPARMTVSEVKRRLEGLEETGERSERPFKGEPVFDLSLIEDAASDGALRGRMTHLVLQHVDLLGGLDYFGLSAQIDGMIDRGLMTEDDREVVDIEKVAGFFESDLGRLVREHAPGRVRREMHFLMGLRPSKLGLDELAAYDESERIRVQGIMDCVVETDEGLVLIDYKTDRVGQDGLPDRVERYRAQMRLYGMALRRIYNVEQVKAHLYFLTAGQGVGVEV